MDKEGVEHRCCYCGQLAKFKCHDCDLDMCQECSVKHPTMVRFYLDVVAGYFLWPVAFFNIFCLAKRVVSFCILIMHACLHYYNVQFFDDGNIMTFLGGRFRTG